MRAGHINPITAEKRLRADIPALFEEMNRLRGALADHASNVRALNADLQASAAREKALSEENRRLRAELQKISSIEGNADIVRSIIRMLEPMSNTARDALEGEKE